MLQLEVFDQTDDFPKLADNDEEKRALPSPEVICQNLLRRGFCFSCDSTISHFCA